jgi:hypothetical protein
LSYTAVDAATERDGHIGKSSDIQKNVHVRNLYVSENTMYGSSPSKKKWKGVFCH